MLTEIGHSENTFVFVKEISAFFLDGISPLPELPQGDRIAHLGWTLEIENFHRGVRKRREAIYHGYICKATSPQIDKLHVELYVHTIYVLYIR